MNLRVTARVCGGTAVVRRPGQSTGTDRGRSECATGQVLVAPMKRPGEGVPRLVDRVAVKGTHGPEP
jgi:hypothetical protein